MTDNSDTMKNYFKDRSSGMSYCKMTLRNCATDCRTCYIPIYLLLKKNLEDKPKADSDKKLEHMKNCYSIADAVMNDEPARGMDE